MRYGAQTAGLPRPLSSLLTQLRNGQSHLAADRYRARVVASDRCECGSPETVSHFLLSCPLYRPQRRALAAAVGPHFRNLPLLLTAPEVVRHTLAFVLATGRFSRYHTRFEASDGGGKAAKGREEKAKGGRATIAGGGRGRGGVRAGMVRMGASLK
ncbi:hypothetical protein JCM10213_005827 [Rhodosporidiobolus nylandii]